MKPDRTHLAIAIENYPNPTTLLNYRMGPIAQTTELTPDLLARKKRRER